MYFPFLCFFFLLLFSPLYLPPPDHLWGDFPPLDPFRRTAKISLSFFPLPPQLSIFLPWRSFRGKPWRLWGRGFTRQPENSKRAHLRAPALQTPPKFQGPPREGRKNENCGGRWEKRAKFWRSGGWQTTTTTTPTRTPTTTRHNTKTDWPKNGQTCHKWIGKNWIGPNRP